MNDVRSNDPTFNTRGVVENGRAFLGAPVASTTSNMQAPNQTGRIDIVAAGLASRSEGLRFEIERLEAVADRVLGAEGPAAKNVAQAPTPPVADGTFNHLEAQGYRLDPLLARLDDVVQRLETL